MYVKKPLALVQVCLCAPFILTACGGGGSDSTPAQPVNKAPTIVVAGDMLLKAGQTASLDASGSTDSDGTISTFAWEQTGGPTVTLDGGATSSVSFAMPDTEGAEVSVKLTLTDDDGATKSETFTLTVNSAPTVTINGDSTADEGTTLTLEGAATDPDNNVSAFQWRQVSGPAATLSNATTATLSAVMPMLNDNLPLVFELKATDELGLSATQTFEVTVIDLDPNITPTIVFNGDALVNPDQTVNLDVDGSSDVDGTITGYLWEQVSGPDVTLSSTDTSAVSFTAPSDDGAVVKLKVTLTDNDGDTSSDTFDVTVNSHPVVMASGPADGIETTDVTLDGAGTSDADDNLTEYLWTQTAGPAATIATDTALSTTVTLPVVSADTTVTFELTATDALGLSASKAVSLTVLANEPPELTWAFPASGGRFFDTTLNLHGTVTDDRDLTDNKVIVSLAGVEQETTVGSDGAWELALTIDSDPQTLTLEVTAEDNIGEQSTTISQDIEYLPTLSGVLFAVDSEQAENAYVLVRQQKYAENYRVLHWNLGTGLFDVLWNPEQSNENALGDIADIALDSAGQRVLVMNTIGDVLLKAFDLTNNTFSDVASRGALGSTRALALSSDGSKAYVVDSSNNTVITVDLGASPVTAAILSGPSDGTGQMFTVGTRTRVFVRANGNLALYDDTTWSIFGIDSTTGDRTILSSYSLGTGSGPAVGYQQAAYDAVNDVLVGINDYNDVMQVNLATGERTQLSDLSSVYSGLMSDMQWDMQGNRFITSYFEGMEYYGDTHAENKFVEIDGAGIASVLLSDNVGSGDNKTINGDLVTSSQTGKVYAISLDSNSTYQAAIVEFDPESGTTAVINNAHVGLNQAHGLTISSDGKTLYFGNSKTDELYKCDIATGTITYLTQITDGVTTDKLRPVDLDINAAGTKVYVLAQDASDEYAVIEVTIADLNKRLVTDNSTGLNSMFVEPTAIAAADDAVYVGDNGTGATNTVNIQKIDISTGNTSVFTDNETFDGNTWFNRINDLVLDSDNNRLYVAHAGRLAYSDLGTGYKTLFSSGDDYLMGKGEFASFNRATLKPGSNFVYAVDNNHNALYAVDVTTGDRIMVQRQ